jgi:hypothetical protein
MIRPPASLVIRALIGPFLRNSFEATVTKRPAGYAEVFGWGIMSRTI